MDDNTLDRLFSGDLSNLIQLPKRVVRLFISSTFTDMTLERNSLMERVYPRLKRYCREKHGLDFQDMRWGVRDEATDDHQTVNLCSREIDNCQRMSLGPNFVALLGDKYGFRPLCNRIRSSEYRALRRSLIELDINTDFLDTWYKEDLNAVPPEYLLQPISSILKNFTNKNEPELQSVDQRIWQAIQGRLHELLMIGSSRLVKQGRMSEHEQLMKYSISVTEREVIEGCLDVNDAKSHCLVYVRSILELQTHLDKCLANFSPVSSQQQMNTLSPASNNRNIDPVSVFAGLHEENDSKSRKASLKIGDDIISLKIRGPKNTVQRRVENTRKLIGRYVDLNSTDDVWRIDETAQMALTNLKEVKLATKMRNDGRNFIKYKVIWNEQEGLSLKCDEHKHYLNELNEHFYTNLTRMIRKASRNEHEFKSGLISEVLQHSHYARHVSKTFHGRSDELSIIRSYISSSFFGAGAKPMFIYGVGGSGKTSILARAATLSRDWILRAKDAQSGQMEERWDRMPCIIMRFCCATPSSSSMIGVLTSVCRQLQFNFYQFGPLNGAINQNETSSNSTDDSEMSRQLPYQPIPEDFVRLVFMFRQLLDNCRHHYHKQRMFLIILDSVERLSSPAESSVEVKYSWLTSIEKLPPNVRLIASCSSEKTSDSQSIDYLHLKRHFLQSYFAQAKQSQDDKTIGDTSSGSSKYLKVDRSISEIKVSTKSRKSDKERYHPSKCVAMPATSLKIGSKMTDLHAEQTSTSRTPEFALSQPSICGVWILHVKPMGVELALNVVQRWLIELGRVLTQQQWSIVEKSFASCSRPIFIKLAFGELVNWKSYSLQSDTKGLTFGSSLLKNRDDLITGNSVLDHTLMKLLDECENMEDEFNWHLLSMEQQWLNYLDYKQLKQQNFANNADKLQDNNKSVIISIKTLNGAKSNSLTSSNSPSSSICYLSSTIDDAICQLFARIELQHGYILTKHSLSYITAARNGICENELEDILSLDDVVLDDVFQYHLPPVRRIPPLLWTRIRNDLPDYLSERDADGIVINWHHSQFRQVTQKRYLSDPQQVYYIHSTLADYFLGKWADKPKPFRCTKQQIQMAAEQLESAVQQSIHDSQTFGGASGGVSSRVGQVSGFRSGVSFSVRNRLRSSDQQDQRLQWMQAKADRRVPHQPLHYYNMSKDNEENLIPELGSVSRNESQKRRYNLRKLTELPYHLIRSGRFLDLANEVLFNYRWLFAALDSQGLQCLLSDFSEAGRGLEKALHDSELCKTNELLNADLLKSMINQLNILNNTVRLSCSAIHANTHMLAPQLIGRLLPLTRRSKSKSDVNYLIQLLEQCDKDGCSDCALLPTDHCLQSPEGLQLSSLEGHSFAIMSMSMAADQKHLLAVSNKFIMWDISTGEISRDVDPKIEGSIMKQLKMGQNNEYAIAYTSNNVVLVLDILTQQVSKFNDLEFNRFVRGHEPIIGLDLVERVGATRFVVWTRARWFVLHVVIVNEFIRSASMPHRVTIKLEYSIDLNKIADSFMMEILNVQLVATTSKEDMAFVEIKAGQNQLQLITVEVSNEPSSGLRCKLWQQRIEGTSISLDASLRRLVFSDSRGDVYLSRRRVASWSKPKLIRLNSRGITEFDGCSLAEQLNSMADRSSVMKLETKSVSIPFAIELDSGQNSMVAELNSIPLTDHSKEHELAEFERQVDAIKPNDEIDENCVFRMKHEENHQLDIEKSDKRRKILLSSQVNVRLVKLYFSNKIVVFRLDSKDQKDREKSLLFPRNVRDISVEANKHQIKSLILGDTQSGSNYLVAAIDRRLLIYSMDNEQFLKSIDAHNARIVQLIPIFVPRLTKELILGGNLQLSIASASMDKTVKIWNLSNLDKEFHTLDKLDNCIESVSLSFQRPLVACLARGELGIWDWRTLKLEAKLSQNDVYEEGEQSGSRIVKCRFSTNGLYLCLATINSIHMMAIDESQQADSFNSTPRKAPIGNLSLNLCFKYCLPATATVRRMIFFHHDSRVLCTLDLRNATSTTESINESTDEINSSSDQTDERLNRRLLILCHSVPDGLLLYTIDHFTPTIQTQIYSHYLGVQSGEHKPGATATTTCGRRPSAARDGTGAHLLLVRGHETRRQPDNQRVRLPVLTRDQLHVVTVESGLAADSLSEHNQSSVKLATTKFHESCKSSAKSKSPIFLNVYSTRDGFLVRSINLNQLEMYNVQSRRKQSNNIGSGKVPIILPESRRSEQTDRFATARAQISINGDQFSRIKSVNFRERQSIVALIDDAKGLSFLIDVSTKQVMACSSIWNGKLSSDGRFGLSRMFKSALLRADNTAKGEPSPSGAFSTSGLQLLEMSRCSPVKSLLTNETLSKLSGSVVHTTAGSGGDIICGFTRPNDHYVYYYDTRLRRLLLIRVRDGRLIANYQLSAAVSKIKCSTDGYALILGLADGSLTSLAIVDPLNNDTLVCLAEYPSRKRG